MFSFTINKVSISKLSIYCLTTSLTLKTVFMITEEASNFLSDKDARKMKSNDFWGNETAIFGGSCYCHKLEKYDKLPSSTKNRIPCNLLFFAGGYFPPWEFEEKRYLKTQIHSFHVREAAPKHSRVVHRNGLFSFNYIGLFEVNVPQVLKTNFLLSWKNNIESIWRYYSWNFGVNAASSSSKHELTTKVTKGRRNKNIH